MSEEPEGRRFIADAMLGKLARWMRTLGYDVEYEKSIGDEELVKRALDEDRLIITRDTLLIKRRKVRGRFIFVKSDKAAGQLKEITGQFKVPRGMLLTRCLRCNTALIDADKGEMEGRVPPYVFKTQEHFSVCTRCGRIYWGGTHRARMVEEIEKMLKGGE